MSKEGNFVLGMLVGAGIMYLLDPDRGRRRRALIRDQVIHGAHEIEGLGDAAASRARHLRNRALGAVHETRSRLSREGVDDSVLEGRVRSELGRLSAQTSGIQVSADHGRIVLTGDALAGEIDALVSGLEGVRGVREVVNRLSARPEPASDMQRTNL